MPTYSRFCPSISAKEFVLKPVLATIVLLVCSNVFMTFAWYAHLKELNDKVWIVAALASWGLAFFEYLFQVPANRIGYTVLSVGEVKIIQEVIPMRDIDQFALLYLEAPF